MPDKEPVSGAPVSTGPERLSPSARLRELPALGDRLEGELEPGASESYHLDAAAGHYLHVVVEQQGVDVVVTLVGPDGESLLQMDRPIDDQGPEPIFAITGMTGRHVLRLDASAQASRPGNYVIRLLEYRPASDRDRARAKAASIYSDARNNYHQGAYKEAVEHFHSAAVAWQEVGDQRWQGESILRKGLSYSRLGAWESAESCYTLAADLFREAGSDRWEATALHHIGLTHYYLADPNTAIFYFRKALSLRQAADSRRGKALTYHALGQAFQVQDEVQLALDYYAQALDLFEKPKDRATCMHSRGVLFLSLGQMESARQMLAEAEELFETSDAHHFRAATLNQLGELYRIQGELGTALNYFSEALALRRKLEHRRGEANTLAKIGSIHQAKREFPQALKHYHDAIDILGDLEEPWHAARVLLNLGSLQLERGRPQEALEVFKQSNALYRRVGDPTGEAEGLLGVARAERRLNNLAAAKQASELALGIFESVRPKAVRHDYRSSFFATVQQHFEFHVDLLMHLHLLEPSAGHDAAALQISEQARARSLLDLLVEAGAEIRSGAAHDLLEREKTIQGQLNAKERTRLGLHSGPRRDPRKLAEIERSIDRLLQELKEVQADIRQRHPRYEEFSYGRALDAGSIQGSVLDEQTLLLEYWLGEERSFLWAVTKESVNSFELPGKDELETLARSAYRLLIKGNRRETRLSTSRALCSLSEKILEPVAGLLEDRRLLIVADEALQYIPFAALPEPRQLGACLEAEPLVVAHEITYLPSASVHPVLNSRLEGVAGARTVAVFADPVFNTDDPRVLSSGGSSSSTTRELPAAASHPSSFKRLPFSRMEADAILSMLGPGEGYQAVDFEARKEAVLSTSLSRFRYVHLATHGILDTTNPELSGIVFSLVDRDGRPLEGFLRAHEILRLKLACDLVVLSACETALGKEIHGEGLVGLTRGFMYAGAARVMVSLWKINDQKTAELMELFYRALLEEGLQPAAALRAAQVAMLRSESRPGPYYWAGFVVQGQ